MEGFQRLNSEAKESKVMQEALTHGLKDNIASKENMRKDPAASRERVQSDLERYQKMTEQHVQRINSMFNLLSSLPQFQLSPNFPPQAVADPILPSQGTLPMTYGLQEAKELLALKPEIQVRCSSSHTSNYTPMSREGEIRWTDLAGNLHGQFGMKKNMIKVTKEFNKLSQEGSVIDYWDRFEELRSLLWSDQPALTEHYFVSRFVSGLKDKLRSMVRMMMPTSVKEAAERARLQELALEAIFRKQEWQPNSYIKGSQLIEGASKAANYGQQESEGNLELDRPIKTENSSNKERSDMDISKNYSLYLQETDGVASEYEDDVADRFHANDGRQPRNEDLDQRKKQEVEDLHNPAATVSDSLAVTSKGALIKINGHWSTIQGWLEINGGCLCLEEISVEGNKILVVLLNPLSVGELQHRIRFWPATKLEFLSMIGNDMVAAITDQLEAFSMEIRMRGMAGLAVAASHSTNVFEEKDTKRQKEKKTRDKHKKWRRRNQIARAGIG